VLGDGSDYKKKGDGGQGDAVESTDDSISFSLLITASAAVVVLFTVYFLPVGENER
jgi:hypothetical protein